MSLPLLEHIVLYTDGACRGNPGPSGAGWVIESPAGDVVAEGCAFLGQRTNNEAEYIAAAMGLKAIEKWHPKKVTLRADSQLMIRQITGQYQVRNVRIVPLYQQVMSLIRGLAQFDAQHVPRAQNARADAQANRGIDEYFADS